MVVVLLAKLVLPVPVKLVTPKLVLVLLLITPLIAKKLLLVLLVEDELVEKRLVEVALISVALVDPRLVLVPLVKNPLVENRLVEVALVITDEVAKMFCENRLRKRRDEEPSEKVASVDGVMLPAICSLSVGTETPIPTLPVYRMVKSEVVANPAVVEDTEKRGRVEPRVP